MRTIERRILAAESGHAWNPNEWMSLILTADQALRLVAVLPEKFRATHTRALLFRVRDPNEYAAMKRDVRYARALSVSEPCSHTDGAITNDGASSRA